MPLHTKDIEIPFVSGLDQATSPKLVGEGKLLTAENLRLNKTGAYDKRFGMVKQGLIGSSVGVSAGLFARDTDVVTVSGNGTVRGYAPVFSTFRNAGRGIEVDVSRRGIAGGLLEYDPATDKTHETTQQDVATGSGMIVHVWIDRIGSFGQMKFLIEDATTHSVVLAGDMSDRTDCAHPRVAYLPGAATFVVVFVRSSINNIYMQTLNQTGPGSEITLETTNNTAGEFEISALSTTFAMVWQPSTGTSIRVTTHDTVGNQVATCTPNLSTSSTKAAFGLDAHVSGSIWVSWADMTGGTRHVYWTKISQVTMIEATGGPWTLVTTTTEGYAASAIRQLDSDTTKAALLVNGYIDESPDLTFFTHHCLVNLSGTALSSAANRKTWHTMFVSKPWDFDGKTFAVVDLLQTAVDGSLSALSTSPESLVVCDVLTDNVDSHSHQMLPSSGLIAPRYAKGDVDSSSMCSAVSLGSSRWLSDCRARRSNDGRLGMYAATFDHASLARWRAEDVGGVAYYTPGGVYDGNSVTETGILQVPGVVVVTPGTGSGNVAVGDYYYVVMYSDVDRYGNIIRGVPSEPVLASVGSTGFVTVEVNSLTVTRRASAIDPFRATPSGSARIDIYRTTVGGTQLGPFHHLASVANDTTARRTTYTDKAADADLPGGLAVQALVYTTGGVLEDVAPPAMRAIVQHANRLWVLAEDGRTVYFTKAIVAGEAPAFCDEFTLDLPVDEDGVAMASLDANLVLFTRSRIFVVPCDDGPNDLGTGASIAQPRRVATDVGCVSPRSVVLTPQGVIFMAAHGRTLLTRGLEVMRIGGPTEDTDAAYPTACSAITHPNDDLAYFSIRGATYGVRCVWSDKAKSWTVDELQAGANVGTGQIMACEASVNGSVYALSPSGVLYKEDTSTYLDSNASTFTAIWITARAEVTEVHLNGLQGFQRVKRMTFLGDRHTSHGMRFEIAYDYSTDYESDTTWTDAFLDTQTKEQIEQHLEHQKCESIRVRMSDLKPVTGTLGTGQGATWHGLRFEIGVKSGRNRLEEREKG